MFVFLIYYTLERGRRAVRAKVQLDTALEIFEIQSLIYHNIS